MKIMDNKVTWISVFVTCILTSKEKDSSECQKYGFKSTMLYMMIAKPVENWHNKQTFFFFLLSHLLEPVKLKLGLSKWCLQIVLPLGLTTAVHHLL